MVLGQKAAADVLLNMLKVSNIVRGGYIVNLANTAEASASAAVALIFE